MIDNRQREGTERELIVGMLERKSICTELLALSIALLAKDENKKFTADKDRIGYCNLRRELLRRHD